MWIFETTNRLHGSKSRSVYAGVELPGDPPCEFTVHPREISVYCQYWGWLVKSESRQRTHRNHRSHYTTKTSISLQIHSFNCMIQYSNQQTARLSATVEIALAWCCGNRPGQCHTQRRAPTTNENDEDYANYAPGDTVVWQFKCCSVWIQILDFMSDKCAGCLKNPHQQCSKVQTIENMNHEVSKTSKIIKNGSLSMILCVFKQDKKK